MRLGAATKTTCPSSCGATAGYGGAAPEGWATIEQRWSCLAFAGGHPPAMPRDNPAPALPPQCRRHVVWACDRLDGLFLGLARPLALLALVGVEPALPEADRPWRHFHQFVVLNIGQRPLQGQTQRRRQGERVVLAGGAN